MSKRALGKGLGALIQETGDEVRSPSSTLQIPIDQIRAGSTQPRITFDEESLADLAASIQNKGILQPILVEKVDEMYTIIAGERRFRAAKIAGLREVPALVGTYKEDDKLQISLIENIQRENLNPIEEATAYNEILNKSSMSQEDLAKAIGKKRTTIANSLRLLKLPGEMKKALEEKILTSGHARAILAVINIADQKALFDRIIREGLSVREAEAKAEIFNLDKKKAAVSRKKQATKDRDLEDVEQRLIEVFGTKVRVKGTIQKGTIEISFFSIDDLKRLYDIMAGAPET